MGRAKLLLPWRRATVIDAVLSAWVSSVADQIVVVVRKEDRDLIDACRSWDVDILPLPFATAGMKETVVEGLKYIAGCGVASDQDQLLIAPADVPRLTSDVIDRVAAVPGNHIVVPYFGGRSGHPVRIPWLLHSKIRSLSAEQGLDSLIRASQKIRIDIPETLRPRDIDTPDDYRREFDSDG